MKRLVKKLKNHFISHHENDYRPHALRHSYIIFTLLLICVFQVALLAQINLVFNKTNFLASVLPGVLTSQTNEERAKIGEEPLANSILLQKAAQLKANDMAEKGYFSHISPDGTTPWQWLDGVGYEYTYAGENLAVNFSDSTDVTKAWMNSPAHKENIIKNSYKEIGIATAHGVWKGQDTTFVVQFFATPPIKESLVTVQTNPEITKQEEQTKDQESLNLLTENTTEDKVLGEATFIDRTLTSPRKLTNTVYTILSIILLIPMISMILINTERRHPKIILKGMSLIVLIFVLSFINLKSLSVKIDTPDDNSFYKTVLDL